MENLTNLIHVKNGETFTNSKDIATVFSKRHDNVLRAIENFNCSDEFRQLNFEAAEYIDLQGKPRFSYNLTKKGATFLILSFTGKKADEFREAYINAFDEMESQLKLQAQEESKRLLRNKQKSADTYNRLYREQKRKADLLESELILNHQPSLSMPEVETRESYTPRYLMSGKTNLENLLKTMSNHGCDIKEQIRELHAIKFFFGYFQEESRKYSSLAAQLAHETSQIPRPVYRHDIVGIL